MKFPYDGKSTFMLSADPAVKELQQAVLQMQDMLLGSARVDPDVTLIARFDGSLQGHLGQQGQGTAPVRYWEGRFDGSTGLLVEEAGMNLVPNPSAEVDLAGWSASDSAVSLSRATDRSYKENGTVSVASFKLAGTGKAGHGYVKSTVAADTDASYSASAYVYAQTALKAKLELAFSGGTPANYDTGEITLAAGEWTRLELADQPSGDNTSCEIRIHLVQLAPEFTAGSRFSKRTPSGTAPVSDNALGLLAGDVVMCAVSANPAGPESYSWHMITTGATGVSNSALRLDGAGSAPTFAPGSRLSQWSPDATMPDNDNSTTLNAGDMVFCQMDDDGGYAWHLVTTAGTAVSSTLRLDDAPTRPRFAPGSRLSRFVPTATAAVSDAAMTINAGDLALCHTLSSPAGEGYRFHIVSTGATGVSSSALRLDDAAAAPIFAAGSRFSRLSPSATALVTDAAMNIAAGDLVFASPTRNPAGGSYGWHMATTAGTGVSSSTLRLDQSSSDVIHADAIQLEPNPTVSSFVDSYQGSGFSGALGGSTQRAESGIAFVTDGILSPSEGTVAFWMQPFWDGDDGEEHVLFDLASGPNRNRIRFSKSPEDELVLSIYDGNAQLKQVVSTSPVSFLAGTWQHLAFTYGGGALEIYHNGEPISTSTVGSGSGQISELPEEMRLGSDFDGAVTGGAVFDDLVVKSSAASDDEMATIALGNSPFQGMALAMSGFSMATGSATTHATPGTETSIAHGLGVPPGFIVITEEGNGLVYLSDLPDESNIYVKSPGSSVDFSWRAYA